MKQLFDWLGSFIEAELRAVVAWKTKSKNARKSQVDVESRFRDDGSNYTSVVTTETLPNESKLQISQVLSIKDPVTLLVTDGVFQVKARLSAAAVAILENGLDEDIDLSTTGDVFQLREVSVISTPFGPSEEHVQLSIQDLIYLYHLRKPVGQPKPIEERKGVVNLLEEITALRHQQYALIEDVNRSSSSPERVAPQAGAGASHHDAQATSQAQGDTPKSQRSVQFQSSPPSVSQQSPTTQFGLATQVPNTRRPNKPTLSDDGFEIQDGANLDHPVKAGFGSANRRTPLPSHTAPPAGGSTSYLLGLLGKRKAEAPPAELAAEIRAPSPKRLQVAASPTALNVQEEILQPSPSARSVEEQPIDELPSAQPIPQDSSPSRTMSRNYSRRRVPRDQQKLLDKASSWIPSLPGQQFPRPNIPIDLLTKWNTEMQSGMKEKAPTISSAGEIEPPAEQLDSHAGSPSSKSNSSTSDSTSEDEEFSASQWPPSARPSPSERKDILPPDSTIGSRRQSPVQPRNPHPHIGPNESASGHVSTPKTITHRPPDPAGNTSESTASQTPKHTSGRSRAVHPLPKRPDWISTGTAVRNVPSGSPSQASESSGLDAGKPSLKPSPSRKFSSPIRSSHHRSSSGGHAIGSEVSPLPFQRSRKDFLPVRSGPTTPKKSPTTNRHDGRPSNTMPSSVIKATQLNGLDGSDDIDIEMSVPQALDQDPQLAHRQRRSKFFNECQRKRWIEDNYIPDLTRVTLNFMSIYTTYKSSHPKDMAKPADFAEAIKAVYPNIYDDKTDDPIAGLKLRSQEERDNVQPPSSPGTRPSTTNLDEAVETPEKPRHDLRVAAGLECRTQEKGGNVLPPISRTLQPPTHTMDVVVELPGKSWHEQRLAAGIAIASSNDFLRSRSAMKANEEDGSEEEGGQVKQPSFSPELDDPQSSDDEPDGVVEENFHPASWERKLPWARKDVQSSGSRRTTQTVVGKRATASTASHQQPTRNDPALRQRPSPTRITHSKSESAVAQDYLKTITAINRRKIPSPQPQQPHKVVRPQTRVTAGEYHKRAQTPVITAAEAGKVRVPRPIPSSTSKAPHSAFAEYVRAWKSIRPGGAFAAAGPENGAKRAEGSGSGRRQLNVLDWEL